MQDEQIQEEKRIIQQEAAPEEQLFETTLRPQTLAEFVGQEHLKENLSIFIEAAKHRQEPLEHVLFYGNPGLGKTTLAHIIAAEMQAHIRVTSGPAIERVGDLAAILSNLKTGDILFIDEIHRLSSTIEEILYPVMEDYTLDIVLGKGPAARTIRMPLEHFTIVGATTKMSLLSSPFRDRFGSFFHLNYYEDSDIERIVKRSARILNMSVEENAYPTIATRSRKTPRVANRLLRRVRDFADVRGNGVITETIAKSALDQLKVDPMGLDQIDRKILETMMEKFCGGPVGLNTLSASVAEEMDTIENIYEPFLLQLGLIARTPKGRIVTEYAYKHLGKKMADTPTLL